ncbi:hypothetical protein K3495_g16507, partial [Podosphaera aphanis]
MFDPEAETILEADSSGYAIGGVVSQMDEKRRLRPVGFFSRKLTAAESNYEIHDKELLAILSTIKHFRGELRSVSTSFLVLSDHRNLRYFMSTRQLSERQVRWAEELSNYNFEIKFRPGIESTKPDLLSRKTEFKPKDFNDERLKRREFQLLKHRWVSPLAKEEPPIHLNLSVMETRRQAKASIIQSPNQDLKPIGQAPPLSKVTVVEGPPKGKDIFDEIHIQKLWDQATKKDPSFK